MSQSEGVIYLDLDKYTVHTTLFYIFWLIAYSNGISRELIVMFTCMTVDMK